MAHEKYDDFTSTEVCDILAAAQAGLWRVLVDKDGVPHLYGDRFMYDLCGFTHDIYDLPSAERMRVFSERIHPEDVDLLNAYTRELIAGKQTEIFYRYNHPEKGLIYVRCSGIRDNKAGEIVLKGFHQNVTKAVRIQQKTEHEHQKVVAALNADYEKAYHEAKEANEAKTRFLFNMSHDIRTPMNAIMGYTELIKKNLGDQARCADYVNKIQSSGEFLLSLINNVLEMARIESGRITLDDAPTKTMMVVQEINNVFSELMKSKRLDFKVTVQVTTAYVFCDLVKLNEIFLNLVSNAYKYTPEGGRVEMKVEELPGPSPEEIFVRTSISDTGIGMSEEYLPVLFTEFSREFSATDAQVQGTGLGMPIVKKLIELMHGTITVESKLGQGTTFVVTIPHRIARAEDMEADALVNIDEASLQGKRILLAEDNDFNAEIAMEILSMAGFEVERATDGIICVDMLQKAPEGYYDAILMDIQMPNMDGYKATQIIRRMEAAGRRQLPIIALTANAFEEDKQNALAIGMNGHLSKPIEIPKLIAVLAESVGALQKKIR